ncbi:UNVERIFIED_ORG: putative intracellular protease/amidase [Rahnella aquatilis]|jgi:putative intracellular protease/amidase|nr:putative intracellular protease/amidase [Rahnella aquatilis]
MKILFVLTSHDRLVTGQNPASSEGVAQALLRQQG